MEGWHFLALALVSLMHISNSFPRVLGAVCTSWEIPGGTQKMVFGIGSNIRRVGAGLSWKPADLLPDGEWPQPRAGPDAPSAQVEGPSHIPCYSLSLGHVAWRTCWWFLNKELFCCFLSLLGCPQSMNSVLSPWMAGVRVHLILKSKLGSQFVHRLHSISHILQNHLTC